MTQKPYLYIYSEPQTFNDIIKQYPQYNCQLIHDENYLNGRWPGRIMVIEPNEDKWNHIGIMGSIEYYLERPEWNELQGIDTNPINSDEPEVNNDYGIN